MPEQGNHRPPRFTARLLRWFCRPELLEDLEGDLNEIFDEQAREDPKAARKAYNLNVMKLFRPGIIRHLGFNSQLSNPGLLRNFLVVSFRQAKKYRSYTLMNILGLTVGLTASLLIHLWVESELSVDQFHSKKDRIYQVFRNMHQSSGEINTTEGIPQPLQYVLEEEYPEIEKVAIVSWSFEYLMEKGELKSYESGRYASRDFFHVFSFPLILGEHQFALKEPNSMLISESLAKKYFGKDWLKTDSVIGSFIRVENKDLYTITGVFQDPGPYSSLQFDFILSGDNYIKENEWVKSWYNGGFRMFFTLKDESQYQQVAGRIEQEVNKHTDNAADERMVLQKFNEGYLNGNWENGLPNPGRLEYVRILRAVSIFLVLISAINFLNLATAKSAGRLRELGVRKVLGSYKSSLGIQFLIESFQITLASFALCFLLTGLLISPFEKLTGQVFYLDLLGVSFVFLALAVLFIIVLLSSIYPSFILPKYSVPDSLVGKVNPSWRTQGFRKGLVVFQFAISIFMIISSVVISNQVDFIMKKNLGLNRENVLMVELSKGLQRKRDVFRTRIEQIPEVGSMTYSIGNPLNYGRSTGGAKWEGKEPDEVLEVNVMIVGDDFLETLNIDVIEGRGFNNKMGADTSKFLINETAKRLMGLEEPLNSKMYVWGVDGNVIGVIQDFHMASLYEPMEPLIVIYSPENTFLSMIRIGDVQETLPKIKAIHEELEPSYPFNYLFMDEEYQSNYQAEVMVSKLAKGFTLVSIFLSCLGLFGLSSFSTKQRTKEISIRKVLGARVSGIMFLLARGYVLLIFIALLFAVPLAYYFSSDWLENFSFRTQLGPWVFILSGLAALVIGAFTVSIKSFQAASANPVEKLRTE